MFNHVLKSTSDSFCFHFFLLSFLFFFLFLLLLLLFLPPFLLYSLPCTPGKYGHADSNGLSVCSSCPENKFSKITQQTECQSCEVGRSSAEGSVSCSLCPAGKHISDEGGCADCTKGKHQPGMEQSTCIDCAKGKVSSESAASACEECNNGVYQNRTGASACQKCTAGMYKKEQAFDPGSNYNCNFCPLGFHQEQEEQASCLPCNPGRYGQLDGGKIPRCVDCVENTFASTTKQKACQNCSSGRSSSTGSSTCSLCPAGQHVNGIACQQCDVGKYQPDMEQKTCLVCDPGKHQSKSGQAICLPCIPGTYTNKKGATKCKLCEENTQSSSPGSADCTECLTGEKSEEGSAKCTKCEAGEAGTGVNGACELCVVGRFRPSKDEFGNATEAATCFQCPAGWSSTEGSAKCISCEAGKYGNVIGTECKDCEAGQYRKSSDSAISCKECSAGDFQDTKGQASCLPCSPGRYNMNAKAIECRECDGGTASSEVARKTPCDNCAEGHHQPDLGMTQCLSCIPGKYQEKSKQIDCVECDINSYSSVAGSSSCHRCGTGKYTTGKGSASCIPCGAGSFGVGCQACPSGWKRSADDVDLSKCIKCERGETTTREGAASCSNCDLGEYGSSPGICTECPVGQYSDKRAALSCESCKEGKIPNNQSTSCQRPSYKIKDDCAPETQYFDDSDNDKTKRTCRPCPFGANCNGKGSWRDVQAKHGFWRLRVAENPSSPPHCLIEEEKHSMGGPPHCAFSKCLRPDSCHGTPDDEFETCDFENGYENSTCGENKNQSCRLCATCRQGFKRSGSTVKCIQCPPSSTNRAMLGVGAVMFSFGTAILIYMTIKDEEAGELETSDAVKKIILNFLQMLSLAAGLPLEWPPELESWFHGMNVISSAGTTLLVPDCEMTHMKTYQAFYLKQIIFTFTIPMVVILSITVWTCIKFTCGKTCIKRKSNFKNYIILSAVLLLFLLYPMLVKICLSMLKCIKVGNVRYLMADLEEPCFEERHLGYLLLLSIPQVILVVIGLPLLSLLVIVRNNGHFERYNFRIRYGLLYLGYREKREWWEVVVAFRKVFIVMIGTFGAMMGATDLQAFLALFVIFFSLMIHMIGKPFDTSQPKLLLLHKLECAALTLCWTTFWGGLLFFLGHEQPGIIKPWIRQTMSILIVISNVVFLCFAMYTFLQEFIKDYRMKQETKRQTKLSMLEVKRALSMSRVKIPNVKVFPLNEDSGTGENNRDELRLLAKDQNGATGTALKEWN